MCPSQSISPLGNDYVRFLQISVAAWLDFGSPACFHRYVSGSLRKLVEVICNGSSTMRFYANTAPWFVFLIIATIAALTEAQTKTWSGGGNNNNWTTASN